MLKISLKYPVKKILNIKINNSWIINRRHDGCAIPIRTLKCILSLTPRPPSNTICHVWLKIKVLVLKHSFSFWLSDGDLRYSCFFSQKNFVKASFLQPKIITDSPLVYENWHICGMVKTGKRENCWVKNGTEKSKNILKSRSS